VDNRVDDKVDTSKPIVVLSLGTNLGDRESNMISMESRVQELFDSPMITSPLYETEPVGVDAHQNYLNRIVGGEYNGSPLELLAATQAIENSLGRTNKGELAPRTADIDILLFGDSIVKTNELTIPHHALFDRHFEILGVKAVVPESTIPGQNQTFGNYTVEKSVQQQRVDVVKEA